MKLAIIVVYIINEANEKLLDIHLQQIEKNTPVPYTIYCVVRSAPKIRKKLKANPKIKIFDINRAWTKNRKQQASYEHSIYLRKLTDIAVKDDITHIAVFHADSFPVRPWIHLADKLNEQCVLTAIAREEDNDRKPHCSFMFFTKDFYAKYKPTYRLSKKVMKTGTYQAYCAVNDDKIVGDTGVGFGYRLFLEQLNWHQLRRTNEYEDHEIMGGIYGEVIFHLGAAIRKIARKDYKESQDLVKAKLFDNPEVYYRQLAGYNTGGTV